MIKNINKRLYFLRKLKSFHVDNTLLHIFYKAIIESVIAFAITCWGGNAQEAKIRKINSAIRKANKLKDKNEDPFNDFHFVYILNCQKKILSISKDPSHPLYPQIKMSCRSSTKMQI